MAKKDELLRIKKQNQVDVQKGRRINKKAEEGKEEDAVKVQALDRSYKEVLSTSPLKKRVQLDLYGDQSRLSPQSNKKSRNEGIVTPNKTASVYKSAIKASPNSQHVSAMKAS